MRLAFLRNIDWKYGLISLGLLAGLILVILSSAGVCSEECGETHFWRFFWIRFETLGWIFFITAALLHALSLKFPSLQKGVSLLVFAAVGFEGVLIWLQKWVIGQWCPICLSIAGVIFFLAAVYMGAAVSAWIHHLEQFNLRNMAMFFFLKGTPSVATFMLGLMIAFYGVAKPERSFAEGIDNQDPIFGNKRSAVEVYVVTDWFCPSCRKLEPMLEKMYPRIAKKATLVFVDQPIHSETLNFIPYNLSFMVKEKGKYFEIRRILHRLALKTKTPTPEEVQAAVKPLGVKYKQLNYSDIDSGVRFFQGIIKTFNTTSTPTVVIANRKKLNAKKLVGAEITEENVLKAIDEMNPVSLK